MREIWVSATLQELTTKIGSGATPKGGQKSYKKEGISLIRSLNVHDREFRIAKLAFIDKVQAELLDNVVLENDDVLLNITGASIARCCVVPAHHLPARVNQHVSILRTRPELIDSGFLCYLLTSKEYKDLLLQTGEKQGATRQALTKSLIQNFRIKFPKTVAEQKQIVAILDKAFSAIAKAKAGAEKNLANARELFESYLNRVFTQRGEGWIECEIQQHIGFIDYRGKTPTKTENGMRLITAKNIKMGFLQNEPKEFVNPNIYDKWMTRGIPREGDVLFTTEAPLGNVAQLDTSTKVVFAQRVIIMQPDLNKLDPCFLKFALLSNVMQSRIEEQGTGATAKGIKSKLLKKVPIPLPTSLGEQRRLVEVFQSLWDARNQLETIYTQKLANLDELKQSLLQKAFTGQLTAGAVEEAMAV